MNPLHIGVIGASGKVGKELAVLIKNKNYIPLLGIYFSHPPEGFLNSSKEVDPVIASKIDLWIDFSQPEGFAKHLPVIAEFNKPIVSGTTGLNEDQKNLIPKLGKKCPFLWSANMSLGVAVIHEALEVFTKIKHFDFQIEELHHLKKKDSPSGTAIALQNHLKDVVKKNIPEPLSVRGGGIFGVHKIWAMSEQEVITFEHQALNRTVFAEGALVAGVKLIGKEKGVYQLRDVL